MVKTIRIVSLITLVLTLVTLRAITPSSYAKELETTQSESKNMGFSVEYRSIDRVKVLERFFEKFNSPLRDSAETFVRVADKYGIDYTLLPSIACMESTCGKFLIEGTYNPFGWGIYGNQYISFESYDHAIEKVAEGLYEGYFSKGWDTPSKIAPIYTPPNSYNWYKGVTWFTNQIEDIALNING